MKPNKTNRHSERSAAELRNLFFSRPQLFCLFLVLMFIAIGCEEKLTKPPEVTKPAGPPELTKSLHQAVADGDIEQVKLLISKGAEVSAKDEYGQTVLHIATVKGHKGIVEFLLTKGARIDPRDNAGRTPLHYAAGAGWIYGVIGGDTVIANSLLNKGANIDATDRWDWTALHYATQVRNMAMVELLVKRGADLNATNERGHTAFTMARGLPVRYRGHPMESERIIQYNEIVDLLRKDGYSYYVATGGEDFNPGTLQRPFRNLNVAINVAEPGDAIFVRGGVHTCSSSIRIDKSGEKGKPIHLRAYSGESPVFDFSACKGNGFVISGAYWHIIGLTVTKAEDWGIVLETDGAHHNILEQTTSYDNRGTGVYVLNGASNNLIINCDSYRNFDPQTNGENADGFAAARALGKGNFLIGCRAWNNADDGFDFGMKVEDVWVENCYAFRNGENIWEHPCFTGNANGFKLWSSEVPDVLIRCVAWDHRHRGFKLGGTNISLYNCIGFRNTTNYAANYGDNDKTVILRNNISFAGRVRFKPDVDHKQNSWNESLVVEMTEDDFLSLDDSVITGPRNPDGNLPEDNFLRLVPGSDAIDAGTDVKLSFAGKTPDLGAFEYRPAAESQSYVKMLHQFVRDHNVEKIHKMLADGADVNEKDWLGYAPLHWAVYFGYPDVAELLLDSGANPNLISDTGRTPHVIAKAMDYQQIANLLHKHGAKE